MKRLSLIISVLFCLISAASADESEGLSQQARENIAQQTREMTALGIPEAQARKMLTQMVHHRFQQQDIVHAQQTVMAAAKAGLPTEPVMSKAMEGMAKQAEEQQVIAAMETVRSRYAHANRLAKSLSDDKKSIDTLTKAVADSLAAGMKTEDMETLMAQLQAQSRQQTQNKAEENELAIQTMQTTRTMARLGVHSSEVSDALCQALQHRYTYQEMKQLRHLIAKQADRASAQQIANQHAGSIGKGGINGKSGSGGSGSGGGGSGSGGGGSGSGGGGSGSGGGGSGSGGGGSGSGGGGSGSGGAGGAK